MLLPGHAQVHVRVDEAREQVRLRPSMTSTSASIRSPMSTISPPRIRTSRLRVEAGARVEHVGAADQDVGGGSGTVVEHQAGTGADASAGCGAERPASSS